MGADALLTLLVSKDGGDWRERPVAMRYGASQLMLKNEAIQDSKSYR